MMLELSSDGSPTALRVIYYRIESRIKSRIKRWAAWVESGI
jgi:hypothetical protein